VTNAFASGGELVGFLPGLGYPNSLGVTRLGMLNRMRSRASLWRGKRYRLSPGFSRLQD
jgi:hypothetical protein